MTCEKILQNYINENEDWHKKVKLYAVAEDWDAATVDRMLRKMEEEGKIEGGYYKGTYRNVDLKKYRKLGLKDIKPSYHVEIRDGKPVAVLD